MKLAYLAAALFTSVFFLTACTKNTDPGGESTGTILNTPEIVHGIFKVDSVLTSDNYVDISVDVSAGGSFTIKSDTVNGYSFKKSGTISAGSSTVRLYASGKPVATGVNYFTVFYGGSMYNFSVTVFAVGGGFGTALYTLGGSPGNCSISNITGNYIVGLPMTATNKVEMAVNVNTIGTYVIAGAALNGVTFSASGTFTNPGIQNIFLTASGTPNAAGTFNYPVTNGATNCSFPIIYTTVITNATFALSGSPGNCTGAAATGTYITGTALTASNTVIVNVNVTSPGNYSITTPAVNGISFSASGTFNITGLTQVTLTGAGTPTVAGAFNYPLTGGGNTCSFSVTTAGIPAIYSCKIDGVLTQFTNRAFADIDDTGTPYLYLDGFTGPAGPSTVPEFRIHINNLNNTAVLAGTYNENGASLPNGYLISIDYFVVNPDLSVSTWGTFSNVTPPANPPFTIVVTSITATRVIGTFSGQLKDLNVPGPVLKTITEGVFNLPIQ